MTSQKHKQQQCKDHEHAPYSHTNDQFGVKTNIFQFPSEPHSPGPNIVAKYWLAENPTAIAISVIDISPARGICLAAATRSRAMFRGCESDFGKEFFVKMAHAEPRRIRRELDGIIVRLCCRTITLNPFLKLVYWHMNYHTKRHMEAPSLATTSDDCTS